MDDEWWLRRAVLLLLLVVGVATTAFAVLEIREDGTVDEASDLASPPVPVIEPSVPSEPIESDGPLRLDDVIVVGRHGAPAERPEHTEASYRLAADTGVDYLETEVVATQDGELLVRADNELSGSTDVAERPEFEDRRTTKIVDGEEMEGWFTEDFTLDELLTLNAIEPDPDLRPDSASYDGQEPLLGLEDLLDLVKLISNEQDREIGVVVQPRRSAYFRAIGLGMERDLARALERSRLTDDPERVVVESNDIDVLDRLEERLGDSVLYAVVVAEGEQDRLAAEALGGLPDYVDAVAVQVGAFAGECPFDLVDRVHDADLAMVVFPISYENQRLGPFSSGDDPSARGNLQGQVNSLLAIGVDVILAEAPGDVLEAAEQAVEVDYTC